MEIQEKLKAGAIAGCKALGLTYCAAHCELKVQNGEAYLMEIGARMGGDFISTELTHLSSGIDMVAATINVVLGVEPNLNPVEDKHCVCIRYFTPKPGKLVAIENEEVLNEAQVYDAEIYHKVGDVVPEVKSSLDRSGHVIVIADTVKEAIDRAESMIKEVKMITA
jgi:biotin carboxylase